MDSLLLGCIDVAPVIVAFFRLPAFELRAADAAHHWIRHFWRQLLATRANGPHFVARFSVVPIFLKRAFGDLRQQGLSASKPARAWPKLDAVP
jgi:hypothetical protein